jgi:hypothetical protein
MKGGGVVASVALLVVAVVLAIVGGGGDDDAGIEQVSSRVVLAEDLPDVEEDVGHEIYWAGPQDRTRLELSVESDGSVFLRYLTPDANAGGPDAGFLTVGTYRVPDAQGALRRAAQESGGNLGRAEGGGLTLQNPDSQGSVYLAYPDSDLQIEVYDPSPGRAGELIHSGAIEPVGE